MPFDRDQRPLSSDELEKLIFVAKRRNSREGQFVFRTVPYTGLSQNEFLHLRPDWIEWRDSDEFDDHPPVIHVPARDTCRNLKWARNPPDWKMKQGPCQYCKASGETDDFQVTGETDIDGDKPDQALTRERVIPVRSERAETALRRWFKNCNYPGVPYRWDNLTAIIQEIGAASSISRDITYGALRWTFTHILAESGVPKKKIKQYAGISVLLRGRTARQILEESSTEYEFQTPAIDRLWVIDEREPMDITQLASVNGTTKGTESTVTGRMVEAGLLEVSTEATGGHPRKLYSISEQTTLREGGFVCLKDECDETFIGLGGWTQHLNSVHDR